MDDHFRMDYDLDSLEKYATSRFGFDFYVTPRFKTYYIDSAFEELTSLLIRQNAKGVNTFIDIGAHYGFFDVLVGLANPQCKIMAFEPVAANTEILRRNLALSGVEAEVIQMAVSDKAGRATFQVSEASDSSGFAANPNAKILQTLEIEVAALDQYLNRIPPGPVLIKIDTEGNEPQVLEGMRGIIEKIDDLRLIIEFNPECLHINGTTPEALLEMLDGLGFDVFFILDDRMRYERCRSDADWKTHMGEKTYRNIFCSKRSRSLHLCFFSHSADTSGAERALCELACSLTATYGVLCTVLLPRDGALRRLLEDQGAATMQVEQTWWCGVEMPSIRDRDAWMQASCVNLCKILPVIEIMGPDIVVSNTLVIPWGAVIALSLDCPHIWYVHEHGERGHDQKCFFTIQKTLDIVRESSNHIFVNSEAIKDALFPEIDDDHCTVATNIVSLPKAGKTDRAFFRHPTSTKFIICGYVSRPKGHEDAVHAVARLLARGYDVELCVLGNGDAPFVEILRDFVRSETLDDRIHFHASVPNVRQAIEQADIGLVCCRYESFGRVTAESFMLGKPVVGTNTGGTVELIDDGIDGLLYSPGNVVQLTEKLAFFLDNPEKIREFGDRGRELIAQKLLKTPVDVITYRLCRELKGSRNPHSRQLSRLFQGWLQKAVVVWTERNHSDTQLLSAHLAECERELASIKGSRAWKLVSLLRRIRAKLFSPRRA